jgi:hypothetical protein
MMNPTTNPTMTNPTTNQTMVNACSHDESNNKSNDN